MPKFSSSAKLINKNKTTLRLYVSSVGITLNHRTYSIQFMSTEEIMPSEDVNALNCLHISEFVKLKRLFDKAKQT